jgi:hypothetical protein
MNPMLRITLVSRTSENERSKRCLATMKRAAALATLALPALSHDGVAQGGGLWTTRSDMPLSTLSAVAAVHGKIYVIGGAEHFMDGLVLNTVYEYDPEQDTWLRKADMPRFRKFLAAAALDGLIYAIGGDTHDCWGRQYDNVDA